MITIKEAITESELKQFIKFPFSLYKNNKYWVPPLIKDELKSFDKKNPIFESAQAQFFLAYKNNVIVVSIPDYAYSSFGQQFGNPSKTSTEIDRYNAFAKNYCETNGVTFINITDITRLGLTEPDLVATDGLHPSEKAYSLFVDRIAPKASEVVQK